MSAYNIGDMVMTGDDYHGTDDIILGMIIDKYTDAHGTVHVVEWYTNTWLVEDRIEHLQSETSVRDYRNCYLAELKKFSAR